jgi:hypothetical protein
VTSDTPPSPDTPDSIRAAADGEFADAHGLDPQAIAYERQLRAAVGRVMHDAATPPPDLRFRTLTAVAERLDAEARRDRPARRTSERPWDRGAREASARHQMIIRTTMAAACLGIGILVGASFHALPSVNSSYEATLPMSQEITRALHDAFATNKQAGRTPGPTPAHAARAAQMLSGNSLGLPMPLPDFLQVYSAAPSTRNGSSFFEVHFGVFPQGSHDPADLDDVLVLIRPASPGEIQALSNHRLYTILGTSLVLNAYRDEMNVYYFAADAKSAMIRLERELGVDTRSTENDRGGTIIDLHELEKLRSTH